MKHKLKNIVAFISALSICVFSVPKIQYAKALDNESICKSKISDTLLDKMGENEENTVYIWFNDYNEEIVEKEIENILGYSYEDIEESYTAPSKELIEHLNLASKGDPDEYLSELMKNHLELTETERNNEKNKTENYLKVRREVIKKYNTKYLNSITDKLKLDDKDLIYASKYLPVLICNLSDDEILNAANCNDVEAISKYENFDIQLSSANLSDIQDAKEELGIEQINNLINLTGNDVSIGIYESGTIYSHDEAENGLVHSHITVIGNPNSNNAVHAAHCAGIAAGNNGVAPEAHIYSVSSDSDWVNGHINNALSSLELLVDYNVKVVNLSWAGGDGTQNLYIDFSNLCDKLINTTKITLVCATGNVEEDYILSPASAYNCIAVNGFLTKNIVTYTNENVLNKYSYNHGNNCFKPDVVAPSLNRGTSTATAFVTGMIALLYEYKPSLMAHPEAVKSILMASCHSKCNKLGDKNSATILHESMNQGLTTRQGAGIPNIYKMISIVSQHSYGYGLLYSSNNFERTVSIKNIGYNTMNMNVSMAFLQSDVTVTNSTANNINNCDLSLYKESTLVKASNKSNSSTEMLYTTVEPNTNYKAIIKKTDGNGTRINYGYAWSTDDTVFYPYYNEEGIYYIKNLSSNKYLTINNNNVTQENLNNSNSQLWILKKNNDSYYLQSATGTEKSINVGDLISGYYYKVSPSSSCASTSLLSNNDGTYTLAQFKNTIQYKLGIISNSNAAGQSAAWYSNSIPTNWQKWYLEAVTYRKGDVNQDGNINNTDATVALNIYASNSTGSGSYSNIEEYLADYDGDGDVDSSDASCILAIIS